MPLYRIKDKSLLHIHIPKTGGTSLMEGLEDLGVTSTFIQKASDEQYGGVPPQHMDIGHTKMFFDLAQVDAFAVVRDPWHRTVSEYVWKVRSKDFTQLNDWLDMTLENIKHEDHQNHFLPQTCFVNDDVEVFSYKDWDKMCSYVGTKLGIKGFQTMHRKQKRFNYEAPSIDVLTDAVKGKWQDLYREDLEFYHSL
ncbi:MAG: sulfotransferase family 2 domain-containing protein [Bacteroidota bacterium]|nr:sulfotransferase family 2 domain-containing protein [Bacteroidota bacterium]